MAIDYFKHLRFAVLGFHLYFLISGIVLISIGAETLTKYNQYYLFFMNDGFYSIPTFSVVLGTLILISVPFGLYGIYRNVYWKTLAFCCFSVVIFICELTTCIVGFMFQGMTYYMLQSRFLQSIREYEDNSYVQYMWDYIQRKFECCGSQSYTDWKGIFSNGTELLPMSCCSIRGAIGSIDCTADMYNRRNNIYTNNRYTNGCLDSLYPNTRHHITRLNEAYLYLAIIQLIFCVLLFGYIYMFKKNKGNSEVSQIQKNLQQAAEISPSNIVIATEVDKEDKETVIQA